MPPECEAGHVYHLFPVLAAERPLLERHLADAGVGTLVHYPLPVPRQPAIASAPPSRCPVADAVCADVLSIPLNPRLTDADADFVSEAIRSWRGVPTTRSG